MNNILCNINWELIIASIAIIVSAYSLYSQRRHNRLSFKPIPVIVSYNYLSVIRVRLWNKGTGPLIINSLKVDNASNLFDLMPPEIRKLTFVEFIKNFQGRTISPNDSLNLLEFKIRKDTNRIPIKSYIDSIQQIRKILNGLEIVIEYKDTYSKSEQYKSELLDFGLTSDEEFSAFNKTHKQ